MTYVVLVADHGAAAGFSAQRRKFLGGTALAAGAALAGAVLPGANAQAVTTVLSPTQRAARKTEAYQERLADAVRQRAIPDPGHPRNDDEKLYADQRGSYTKALPHNDDGLVDTAAYQALLDAVAQGSQAAFENLLVGGVRRQTNPLAAYAFDLIGADGWNHQIAPAPAFASQNTAVDMLERYWMALTRDVPFARFDSDPLISAAVADLNRNGLFKTEFGFEATPQTIFRAPYKGCFDGPFISQFLYQPFYFGNQVIEQIQRHAPAGVDYLTDYGQWLAVTRGTVDPSGSDIFDKQRYILTQRDGCDFVHFDLPQSGPFNAALFLLSQSGSLRSDANPYKSNIAKSAPFGTFGGPDVLGILGYATDYALRFAWFQKWVVHRRLRPEVFGQRVQLTLARNFALGIDPAVLDSDAVQRIFSKNGTYLLPIAFPEGSPTHPAYPGGHSTFVAVGATLLKAFFDENAEFPTPVVPNADGSALVRYTGEPLTIGGELNKLVSNITLLRDGAGMHWRTDGCASGSQRVDVNTGGNVLGEALAISILQDLKSSYREVFPAPFRFTKFNGEPVAV